MRLVTRAAFGWGPSAARSASPTRGLVIHYDSADQGLAAKSHSACIAYWVRTRKFHMGPARGWADIGYSFGCCVHGDVFEGRGLGREQAAQPGGNDTWYSVTLMSGPSEEPTPAQVGAVRELRAWLMSKGLAGAVRGHRDFYNTSCPGDLLYGLVLDGTFTRSIDEEDDMPTAREIADEVYDRFTHTLPEDVWAVREGILEAGQKIDPRTAFRQIWAYGKDGVRRLAALQVTLDAQNATIKALVDALAARDEEIDVEALVARIESAIENVTVRLEVPDQT